MNKIIELGTTENQLVSGGDAYSAGVTFGGFLATVVNAVAGAYQGAVDHVSTVTLPYWLGEHQS